MSILIKGMEMPTNCWQSPMVGGYELSDEVKARYSALHCRLLRCKTPSGVKPNNCPLVPVPPHGRLGDLDALCKTLRSLAENEYTPEVFANWIENHIDTIIEAEEGET